MHWICTLILILHLYEKLGNRRHQTLPSVLPLVSYFEITPYARRLYLAIVFKREVNYYTRSTLRIATCQSLTKPQWSLDMWFLKYARWNRGVDGHTDTLIAILRTSTWGEVWASADSSIVRERKQRVSMDGKTASLFFLTIRHIQCDWCLTEIGLFVFSRTLGLDRAHQAE